jgi:predicted nucleotidyltransferase
MPEPLIDIRPDHWAIVRDILRKHVPQYEVWAFGSRARWLAKQYSDLDLAVITHQPLSLSVSASLSDDFSESDLPFKVDVLDWATTRASFRKIVEQDKVVVQAGQREGEPPLQQAIAHILGTLDDKIELNRRMIETLEAMARARFKSWFVDFDPVRIRRGDPCGRPISGSHKGGPYMKADILAPFPDRLADSELGEIPEGWEVYRRVNATEEESRTLAALRDALLPKLISSELRVRDAERFMGRAV